MHCGARGGATAGEPGASSTPGERSFIEGRKWRS
jgi:hypothetical protein